MAPTQLRHCVCGATREAPVELRVISCVQCGRALTLTREVCPARPSTSLAGVATLLTQLLGAFVFAVAVLRIARLDDRSAAVNAMLVLGAIAVFAGGHAHRGSVFALICCEILDLAVAVVCITTDLGVRWLAPVLGDRIPIASMAGFAGAVAAAACIAAIPQVRRLEAWVGERSI
jgi:hypothetical protein